VTSTHDVEQSSAEPGLDEIDVLAEFDKAAASTTGVDPHAALRELRERGAVFDGDAIVDVLGARMSLTGFSGRRVYTVLRWDECLAVLRDRSHFSSAIMGESYGASFGKSIFELDDPEHHRLRSVVQRAFTPRGIEQWDESIIRPVVCAAIDRLEHLGRVDLYKAFTLEFPARIIFEMCKLPEDVYHEFMRSAIALLLIRAQPKASREASARLASMLGEQLAARRVEPLEDDLVSTLALASGEEGTITDEEAVSFLRLLLPAGAETTSHSTATLLWLLLQDATLLDQIRSDRSMVPALIEEVLRWEPAVPYAHRLVVDDVTIGGVDIRAGSALQLALGSANRDAARWDEPDRFDITRPAQSNLSLGFGAHACLGASLARREMTSAVNQLLDRFPTIRLDPDAAPTELTGVNFRGPTAVPAVLG
jgi:cytochrome P450